MIADLPPSDPPQSVIVITAKALADPEAERAYDVETIDRATLQGAPSRELDEILKRVPGLQLFRRSDSRSGHPTSQGVTLRALGGNASSRALLVLDGVPQADPFGGWVNWPAYDPASLAQVRVVRGGGSVAYGSGALAGAIAMTSLFTPGLAASLDAGSRESLDGSVRAATRIGSGVAGVTASAARGDGFIPISEETRGAADRPAPYETANLRAFWVAPLSARIDVQASAAVFTDRRERGLEFTENRTDGSDASLRLISGGASPWSATLYGQKRDLRSSFASVNDDRSVATRVSLQDSVPSHAIGANFELRPSIGGGQLRIGGDVRVTEGESRELFSFVAGEATRRRIAGGQTVTAGGFIELTRDIGPMTVSGGARADHWRISDGTLVERVLASDQILRDDRHPDRSGWLPTARLSGVLDAGRGYNVRGAAYLGWRMATLNELFRPFRAGPDATAANPLLDPEELAGAEGGVDYRTAGLELSATVFSNRLRNGIANVTLGRGPGVFPGVGFVGASGDYRQRQNIDAIVARGAEASIAVQRGAWSWRAGASFVDAEIDASGPAIHLDGLRPAQTPQVSLTAETVWSRGRAMASLAVRHSGSQYEDDLNQRRLPAATTLDAAAAWPLSDRLLLSFRGENLLDERVVAGIGGDGSVERATPRTLWIGLRFSGDGAGR